MKRMLFWSVAIALFATASVFALDTGEAQAKFKVFLTKWTKNFVVGKKMLLKSKTAEDVAKAIKGFTKQTKKMQKEAKAFDTKYPLNEEEKQTVFDALSVEVEKFMTAATEYGTTLSELIKKYQDDAEGLSLIQDAVAEFQAVSQGGSQ